VRDETPNHALQRTRPSRPGCNRTRSWAGSLSFVVKRQQSDSPVTMSFWSKLFSSAKPDGGNTSPPWPELTLIGSMPTAYSVGGSR